MKKKYIFTIVFTLLFILVLFLLVTVFNFKTFKTNGSSMYPTISHSSLVMSIKVGEYKRGDIISFDHEGMNTIKRIIGLPGDVISFDGTGNVLVNDNLLIESYLDDNEFNINSIEISLPYVVPDNSYFVLGDNRKDSLDSRINSFGCVEEDDIYGKVFFSLTDFNLVK